MVRTWYAGKLKIACSWMDTPKNRNRYTIEKQSAQQNWLAFINQYLGKSPAEFLPPIEKSFSLNNALGGFQQMCKIIDPYCFLDPMKYDAPIDLMLDGYGERCGSITWSGRTVNEIACNFIEIASPEELCSQINFIITRMRDWLCADECSRDKWMSSPFPAAAGAKRKIEEWQNSFRLVGELTLFQGREWEGIVQAYRLGEMNIATHTITSMDNGSGFFTVKKLNSNRDVATPLTTNQQSPAPADFCWHMVKSDSPNHGVYGWAFSSFERSPQISKSLLLWQLHDNYMYGSYELGIYVYDDHKRGRFMTANQKHEIIDVRMWKLLPETPKIV